MAKKIQIKVGDKVRVITDPFFNFLGNPVGTVVAVDEFYRENEITFQNAAGELHTFGECKFEII